jgi:hypothetical protein
MQNCFRWWVSGWVSFLLLIGANSTAIADEAADLAFFEQKVRPVLIEHCHACHAQDANKVRGGLLLDSRAGWQRGGDSGEPAVVPGKPDESPLILAVRHADGLAMPPDKKLPASVIADLEEWVRRGAFDPRKEGAVEPKRADKSWWSLQPLRDVAPPAVTLSPEQQISTKVGEADLSAIDRFLLVELARKGLTFNPPADARTLIRRMSYDVTGLPPTPDEVTEFEQAFAAQPDAAVEALVDRLLASPGYGEQWGRHWLDVVRFGESNGFERNFLIPDLWPFRDYVIRSLNEDKPFNQFVVEQLAGDVIAPNDPTVEVATAFLVAGPYDDVGNQDVVAQANIRAATLDDIITATGSAFLGLTVNCARCHHHKFDPIPTEDYYRLRAAFEGITHGRRVVASPVEREAHAAALAPLEARRVELSAKRDALNAKITTEATAQLSATVWKQGKVDPTSTEERFEPVEAKFLRFVMQAHTGNPNAAGGARLTEFEVWSAGEGTRNVALASNGTIAEGERALRAADFPEAYGPQLVIDGAYAEQWFIGGPAELKLTFKEPVQIDRVALANSRGPGTDRSGVTGEFPCEYEVLVSKDGETWTRVASSTGREPWSAAHGVARVRRDAVRPLEPSEVDQPWRASLRADLDAVGQLERELAEVQGAINRVPPLRQVWVGQRAQPATGTWVHKGGDPAKPAEQVTASSLAVLDQTTTAYSLPADAPEGERRLALARWIAADNNPLTPRVLANRVWHTHFGTGLVDTPGDFGFLGGVPSHPDLLDWVAKRLLTHGWRLKPLHREILLSRAYRQSSAVRVEAQQQDKDARLLWRFPPRRLSAEELRDTLLAVAGTLDRTPGGPGFRLFRHDENNVSTYTPLDAYGPETYRRAVYHHNVRAGFYDLLSDFDLPDVSFPTPRRARTTTPLQALTLLNHRFTLDMATALARRAESAAGSKEPRAVVGAIYRFVLQREPSPLELERSEQFVQTHGAVAFCRAVLNLNEVLYVD